MELRERIIGFFQTNVTKSCEHFSLPDCKLLEYYVILECRIVRAKIEINALRRPKFADLDLVENVIGISQLLQMLRWRTQLSKPGWYLVAYYQELPKYSHACTRTKASDHGMSGYR